MRYIAALDYNHLDNGVFLTSLARSLSQQQEKENVYPIIVHGDSAYTERIIQTGVMREEATIRSIKDLNHRLVALFADQGVSTVGINPYQRNFITIDDDSLQIDHSFLNTLPDRSVLLLSTLVKETGSDQPVVLDLPRLATFLAEELGADQFFIFNKSDKSEVFTNEELPKALTWEEMDQSFRNERIPDDFNDLKYPVRLATARDFNQIPDLENTLLIRNG